MARRRGRVVRSIYGPRWQRSSRASTRSANAGRSMMAASSWTTASAVPERLREAFAMSFRQQCARRRSGKSSDPAGGSGATLEQQRRCDGSSRPVSVKATRRDHVHRGDLCIVDAAATSSDLELVLGIPNGPTSVHQLVDQLAPQVLRDAGITGPPPSTVDGNEGGLRRLLSDRRRPSSPPRSGSTKIFEADGCCGGAFRYLR